MIASFGNKATEDIFHGRNSKNSATCPAEIRRTARRKLMMLNAAVQLDDLRIPPGNHLEALAGNLAGKHSIRINAQWRIVFAWLRGTAQGVTIVDYH